VDMVRYVAALHHLFWPGSPEWVRFGRADRAASAAGLPSMADSNGRGTASVEGSLPSLSAWGGIAKRIPPQRLKMIKPVRYASLSHPTKLARPKRFELPTSKYAASLFGRINSPSGRTNSLFVSREFARTAIKSLRALTGTIAGIGRKPATSRLFSRFFDSPPQFVPRPFAP